MADAEAEVRRQREEREAACPKQHPHRGPHVVHARELEYPAGQTLREQMAPRSVAPEQAGEELRVVDVPGLDERLVELVDEKLGSIVEEQRRAVLSGLGVTLFEGQVDIQHPDGKHLRLAVGGVEVAQILAAKLEHGAHARLLVIIVKEGGHNGSSN